MNFTLIDGTFSPQEAELLLAELIQTKIRFHESRIAQGSSEDDVKMREKRIKELQHQWAILRLSIRSGEDAIDIHSEVRVEIPELA